MKIQGRYKHCHLLHIGSVVYKLFYALLDQIKSLN